MDNEQTAREIAHKLMSDIGECWPEVIYTVPNGHTNVCNAVTEALNRASSEATERAAKVADEIADKHAKTAEEATTYGLSILYSHHNRASRVTRRVAAAIRASGESGDAE